MAGSVDGADETRSALAPDPLKLARPRLVAVWEGGSASCSIPEQGRLLLGRAHTCDLRIATVAVSREHAQVLAGSPPTIEDLGSSNGTWVDGRRLEANERAPLFPGRMIQLGDTLIVAQAGHLPLGGAQSAPSVPALDESAIERLGRLVDLVATSTLPVILRGETGVGKEVTAERIHARSARAQQPYLRVNCAAFAESMAESELFGHERGAFTGAAQAKPGLFEAAKGGTVLLDEVTELSPAIQAKLLRALGNSEVLRVGALKPTPIDVRFIAATNQDFAERVSSGKFRADLYFRLNGITLQIPPLRERRAEVVPLALEFATAALTRMGGGRVLLSDAARSWLLAYQWPGNVRELKNIIERATLLAQGGPIGTEHLYADDLSQPERPQPAPAGPELGSGSHASVPVRPAAAQELRQELRDLERERIVEAMARAGGNQTLAARLLGISRRALLTRLDNFDLPRPRKGQGSG